MQRKTGTFSTMLILAILSLVLTAGCGGKEAQPKAGKLVIKAAHTTSTDYPYQIGFEAMAKALQEKTKGAIDMQVFPNGQLGGNEREVVEALQLGNVTLTVVNGAVISNFTPKADVFNLPFIFRDLQHLYKAVDGEPGQVIAKELEAKNLKVLAWYVNPDRHMFANKPIVKLADIKGMKIRVTQSPVSIKTFTALGALPTPMAYGELYSGLQQGVVDGAENDWFGIRGMKFYEVSKHISLTGHFMVACPVMVNLKWFNGLPAEQQKAIQEAANEGRDAMRKYLDVELKKVEADVVSKGGVVHKVSDIEAFRAAVQPVYTEFEPVIGKDLIDKVKAIQ
ncbi:MAG: TRAP transporter substrate-binding protein [Sporomusaceae bacterium]|nr:TRAP transporter substrate-binding protein [Sporomusaceae bacterium]